MNNKIVFELNGDTETFTTVVKIVKKDDFKNPFYPEFMGIKVDQNQSFYNEPEKQCHAFISYDNGRFTNLEGFTDKNPFVLVHYNDNTKTESEDKYYFRIFSIENIRKSLNKNTFKEENININDIENFTVVWKLSKFTAFSEIQSIIPSIYEVKIELKNNKTLLYLEKQADKIFYWFYNAYWNTAASLI